MQIATSVEADNGEMIVKRVSVPVGLEELMEGLTKEVILKKPSDIYVFASQYFANLLHLREKGYLKVSTHKRIQSVTKQISTSNVSKQLKTKSKSVDTLKQLPTQNRTRFDSPSKNTLTTKKMLLSSKKEKGEKPTDKAKAYLDKRRAKKDSRDESNKKISTVQNKKNKEEKTPRKASQNEITQKIASAKAEKNKDPCNNEHLNDTQNDKNMNNIFENVDNITSDVLQNEQIKNSLENENQTKFDDQMRTENQAEKEITNAEKKKMEHESVKQGTEIIGITGLAQINTENLNEKERNIDFEDNNNSTNAESEDGNNNITLSQSVTSDLTPITNKNILIDNDSNTEIMSEDSEDIKLADKNLQCNKEHIDVNIDEAKHPTVNSAKIVTANFLTHENMRLDEKAKEFGKRKIARTNSKNNKINDLKTIKRSKSVDIRKGENEQNDKDKKKMFKRSAPGNIDTNFEKKQQTSFDSSKLHAEISAASEISKAVNSNFSYNPHKLRQELEQAQAVSASKEIKISKVVDKVAAVIKIQSIWRGFRIRKHEHLKKDQSTDETKSGKVLDNIVKSFSLESTPTTENKQQNMSDVKNQEIIDEIDSATNSSKEDTEKSEIDTMVQKNKDAEIVNKEEMLSTQSKDTDIENVIGKADPAEDQDIEIITAEHEAAKNAQENSNEMQDEMQNIVEKLAVKEKQSDSALSMNTLQELDPNIELEISETKLNYEDNTKQNIKFDLDMQTEEKDDLSEQKELEEPKYTSDLTAVRLIENNAGREYETYNDSTLRANADKGNITKELNENITEDTTSRGSQETLSHLTNDNQKDADQNKEKTKQGSSEKENETFVESEAEGQGNTKQSMASAAIKIQALWRGFKTREQINREKFFGATVKTEILNKEALEFVTKQNEDKAVSKIQALWRGYKVRQNIKEVNDRTAELQKIAECDEMPSRRELTDKEIFEAASKIQAGVRGYIVRKRGSNISSLKSIAEETSFTEKVSDISNNSEVLNNVNDSVVKELKQSTAKESIVNDKENETQGYEKVRNFTNTDTKEYNKKSEIELKCIDSNLNSSTTNKLSNLNTIPVIDDYVFDDLVNKDEVDSISTVHDGAGYYEQAPTRPATSRTVQESGSNQSSGIKKEDNKQRLDGQSEINKMNEFGEVNKSKILSNQESSASVDSVVIKDTKIKSAIVSQNECDQKYLENRNDGKPIKTGNVSKLNQDTSDVVQHKIKIGKENKDANDQSLEETETKGSTKQNPNKQSDAIAPEREIEEDNVVVNDAEMVSEMNKDTNHEKIEKLKNEKFDLEINEKIDHTGNANMATKQNGNQEFLTVAVDANENKEMINRNKIVEDLDRQTNLNEKTSVNELPESKNDDHIVLEKETISEESMKHSNINKFNSDSLKEAFKSSPEEFQDMLEKNSEELGENLQHSEKQINLDGVSSSANVHENISNNLNIPVLEKELKNCNKDLHTMRPASSEEHNENLHNVNEKSLNGNIAEEFKSSPEQFQNILEKNSEELGENLQHSEKQISLDGVSSSANVDGNINNNLNIPVLEKELKKSNKDLHTMRPASSEEHNENLHNANQKSLNGNITEEFESSAEQFQDMLEKNSEELGENLQHSEKQISLDGVSSSANVDENISNNLNIPVLEKELKNSNKDLHTMPPASSEEHNENLHNVNEKSLNGNITEEMKTKGNVNNKEILDESNSDLSSDKNEDDTSTDKKENGTKTVQNILHIHIPMRELSEIKEEEADVKYFTESVENLEEQSKLNKTSSEDPAEDNKGKINNAREESQESVFTSVEDKIEDTGEVGRNETLGQKKLTKKSEDEGKDKFEATPTTEGKPAENATKTPEKYRQESASTTINLVHTGEFHDMIAVPVSVSPQIPTSSRKEEPKANVCQSSSHDLVNSEKLYDNVPLSIQLDEAPPAGAEVLTSHVFDSIDIDGQDQAQASNKDASTCETQSQADNASSAASMETEKRNNATNTTKKNMEAEAAAKIQAGFRGYQVRKQLKEKISPPGDTLNQRRSAKRKNCSRITESGRFKPKTQSDLEEKSAVKIQAGIRGFLVRRRQKNQKQGKESS